MKIILVFIAVILLSFSGTNATAHIESDNTTDMALRPFDGYLEFAEWVSEYKIPELDGDCDDYAYAMFIDGLEKGYWVSVQLELTKKSGHMFVSGYVESNGKVRVYFIDGETRKIFFKMYGYTWRVD